MRRYLHNGLVALLCVCLLVSYTPLPATANPTQGGGAEATAAQDAGGAGGAGAAAAEGPSVGELGAVDADGKAVTTVNVITTGFSLLGQTEDFADTIETIKTKPIDLNVVTVGGKGPYTCEWTRTVDGVKDAGFSDPGKQLPTEGKTTFTYELSKNVDRLEPQTPYVYSLKVTDEGNTAGVQNTVSTSIAFGITDVKYGPATLTDAATPGLSATFTLVHPQAALAVASITKGSPTYDMLQGAAAGKSLVSGAAYQADLTKVPSGALPFLDAQVSVTISGLDTTYAGKTVTVVGLVNGKTTTQEVAVSETGTATFNTPALGAFAIAYAKPGAKTCTVTSSVTGEGGTVSPLGAKIYPDGATPTYTVLPNAGYLVDTVKLDGVDVGFPALPSGNSYTFDALDANHTLEVAFKKVTPDPGKTFGVTAKVAGGNGQVKIGGKIGATPPTVQVAKGSKSTVQFVPDAGYIIKQVTVKIGDAGTAKPVVVFSDTYAISAVVDNTTVEVTYEPGITPPVITHAITPSPCTNGSISPASVQTVPHAGTASFVVQADALYVIKDIIVNGMPVTTQASDKAAFTYEIENIVGDHTIAATFNKEPDPDKPLVDVEVKVKVAVGEVAGGYVSPSSVAVVSGTSPKFYAYPDEGYTLEWVKVGSTTLETHPITAAGTLRARAEAKGGACWFMLDCVTESLVVDVKFRKLNPGETPLEPVNLHTVTAHEAEGGIISPKGKTFVPNNGEVAYTLQANKGYHLQSLMVGGQEKIDEVQKGSTAGSLNAKGQIIRGMYKLTGITGDVDVVPVFATDEEPVPPPVLFTFTSSVTGGYGKISPEGNVTVEQGKSQVFYFYPDAGYAVASIVIDGAKLPYTATSYEFSNVQGAHTVEVAFGPIAPPALNAATGDNSGVFLLLALVLASAAVCVAAATRRRPTRTRHAS